MCDGCTVPRVASTVACRCLQWLHRHSQEHSQQRLPYIPTPLIGLVTPGVAGPPTLPQRSAIQPSNVTGRSHPWPSQPQPRSSPAPHQPRSVSPPVSLLCLLSPLFSHDGMRIREFIRDSAAWIGHRAASPTVLCSRLPDPIPASSNSARCQRASFRCRYRQWRQPIIVLQHSYCRLPAWDAEMLASPVSPCLRKSLSGYVVSSNIQACAVGVVGS